MDLFELALPANLENIQLPSPELLTFYKLAENRVIYLDDDCEANCVEFGRMIQLWNMEDRDVPVEERKPIKLFIFTDGGDVNAALSLIDVIEQSKTPVYTINAGLACSAGLLILLAGHKRFCYKRSLALIHSGSGQIGGTFEQTEANMAMYKSIIAMIQSFILERSSIDAKTFNKKKSREWYLFAQDQIDNGIVEKIVTSMEEIL